MAAQGNLILIFGVFITYSFIGWGIGELYNEPFEGIDTPDFLRVTNNTEFCYTDDCNGAAEYLPFGSKDQSILSKIRDMGIFAVRLGSTLTMGFEVMTYGNPHIPDLVNVMVITPLNILMVGAAMFLARGGGS